MTFDCTKMGFATVMKVGGIANAFNYTIGLQGIFISCLVKSD